MIQILYPHGCYGSYLTKCIYEYTSIGNTGLTEFYFDDTGSSHDIRKNLDLRSKIKIGHIDTENFDFSNPDSLIKIVPIDNHRIDYHNNHFAKQDKYNIEQYLYGRFSVEEVQEKFRIHWGYTVSTTESIPIWMLREFYSFWLMDVIDSETADYHAVPSTITITTQDIINHLESTLAQIANKFDITIISPMELIKQNHQQFLNKQQYHNQQYRCDQWIDAVVENTSNIGNPCQTIIEEHMCNIF